jgi:hypothetical protein
VTIDISAQAVYALNDISPDGTQEFCDALRTAFGHTVAHVSIDVEQSEKGTAIKAVFENTEAS